LPETHLIETHPEGHLGPLGTVNELDDGVQDAERVLVRLEAVDADPGRVDDFDVPGVQGIIGRVRQQVRVIPPEGVEGPSDAELELAHLVLASGRRWRRRRRRIAPHPGRRVAALPGRRFRRGHGGQWLRRIAHSDPMMNASGKISLRQKRLGRVGPEGRRGHRKERAEGQPPTPPPSPLGTRPLRSSPRDLRNSPRSASLRGCCPFSGSSRRCCCRHSSRHRGCSALFAGITTLSTQFSTDL